MEQRVHQWMAPGDPHRDVVLDPFLEHIGVGTHIEHFPREIIDAFHFTRDACGFVLVMRGGYFWWRPP